MIKRTKNGTNVVHYKCSIVILYSFGEDEDYSRPTQFTDYIVVRDILDQPPVDHAPQTY